MLLHLMCASLIGDQRKKVIAAQRLASDVQRRLLPPICAQKSANASFNVMSAVGAHEYGAFTAHDRKTAN